MILSSDAYSDDTRATFQAELAATPAATLLLVMWGADSAGPGRFYQDALTAAEGAPWRQVRWVQDDRYFEAGQKDRLFTPAGEAALRRGVLLDRGRAPAAHFDGSERRFAILRRFLRLEARAAAAPLVEVP